MVLCTGGSVIIFRGGRLIVLGPREVELCLASSRLMDVAIIDRALGIWEGLDRHLNVVGIILFLSSGENILILLVTSWLRRHNPLYLLII